MIKSLFFIPCALAALLSSCGGSSVEGKGFKMAGRTHSNPQCSFDSDLYKALDHRLVEAALEGDLRASRELVVHLLEQGGDGAYDAESACRLIYWTELSAQNGSLHSAYELASSDSDDKYLCRRSKYWAKVVIDRMEEFTRDAMPDADPELLRRSIAGRKEQMQSALKKSCVAL